VLYYYATQTSTIRGGYFRFIRQYLEKIPIPNKISGAINSKIENLVENMLALHAKLKETDIESDRNTMQSKIEAVNTQIDKLVYELYGLTEDEIKIVEGS
jgi:hypothetical protein